MFSLIPGPSMLYVASRTIGQGRRAGYASAVGLALGGVALAVITALASGWLLTGRPALFRFVKAVGGLYLLYLGLRMLVNARQASLSGNKAVVAVQSCCKIVSEGFIVELLNPKTILFFLAFLPGFVDPDGGSVTAQMMVLGVLVPLTFLPSDLLVSNGGAWLMAQMNERADIGARIEAAGGAVVLVVGAKTLLGF